MTTSGRLLLRHEVNSALRARWFLAYLAVFVVGGLMLSTLGLSDPVVYGYRGFAKAFAGMVHLALLVVPLLALLPAAATISDARENGVLEYVLAQPVSNRQVYGSKWVGTNVGLFAVVVVGFGAAAIAAAMRGVPMGLVAALFAYVILLAICFGSIGTAISGLSSTRARAMTAALVVWLMFTSLGSLGVMYLAIRFGVPRVVLEAWTFLNPVEAFRVGVLAILDPDLGLLGPVGAHLIERFGPVGVAMLGATSVAAWTLLSGLLGGYLFRR